LAAGGAEEAGAGGGAALGWEALVGGGAAGGVDGAWLQPQSETASTLDTAMRLMAGSLKSGFVRDRSPLPALTEVNFS